MSTETSPKQQETDDIDDPEAFANELETLSEELREMDGEAAQNWADRLDSAADTVREVDL